MDGKGCSRRNVPRKNLLGWLRSDALETSGLPRGRATRKVRLCTLAGAHARPVHRLKNARCSKNRLQDPLPRAVGSPAGTSRGRCGSQSTGIRVILYLPLQKNEDRLFGERISSLSVITPETWALSTHTRVLERCALLEEAQLLLLVPAGTRASWTGTCGTRRHCGRPRGPALSYSETQSSKLAADRQLGGPSGSQALQSQRTRVLPGSNRVTLVPN